MQRILTQEKSLLIVCTVLNPFVSNPHGLLSENGEECKPMPGAEKVRIDQLFDNLCENDQKYNLKTVDFILNAIIYKCYEEGFAISLENKDVAENRFETVGDLASRVAGTSMPIWA